MHQSMTFQTDFQSVNFVGQSRETESQPNEVKCNVTKYIKTITKRYQGVRKQIVEVYPSPCPATKKLCCQE